MYSLPVLQQFTWFPGLTPHIAEYIPSMYYKNSPDSLAWLPTSLNVFPPCTTTINLIPWPNSPNRSMYSIPVLKTIHLISWLDSPHRWMYSLYYNNSPDFLAWLFTSLNVFPPCIIKIHLIPWLDSPHRWMYPCTTTIHLISWLDSPHRWMYSLYYYNSPDSSGLTPHIAECIHVLQQFTWFPGLTPHIAECIPCTTTIHLISWLDSPHRWMYSLYYNNSPDFLAWLPTSLNVFPVLQQFTWFPGLTPHIVECIPSLYYNN